MTKILIYTALLFIVITAISETKDFISYLENRSAYSKTPSQMEMNVPLNRKNIEPNNLNFKENTQNMHDKFRKENKKKEQDYYNKQYNKKIRELDE